MMWLRKIFTGKERRGEITVEHRKPIFYHITAAFLPVTLLCLFLLFLFRHFVSLLLTLIYKNRYGGLISNMDTIWILQKDEWKSIVTVLYMLEHDDDQINLLEKMKSRVKEKVFNVNDYPKLTGTCHQLLGQFYLLLNTYSLDDCVREFTTEDNESVSESTLKNYISRTCNKPLPLKDTAMWEILVSNKPCRRNNEGKYLYPVIFRFNHGVADGMAFIEFLIKVFHDNAQDWDGPACQYTSYRSEKNRVENTLITRLIVATKSLLQALHLLYLFLGTTLYYRFLRTSSCNILQGAELCGKKITVWSSEDNPEILSATRRIKSKLQRVTFPHIMLSAVSASFAEYFRKNGGYVPDCITVGIPYLLGRRKIKRRPATLVNDFTIGGFTLPTNQKSHLENLLMTRDHSVFLKSGPDLQLFVWACRLYGATVPANWLRTMFCFPGITAVISTLPFTNSTNAVVGHTLHSAVFFPPHRGKTGLSFGVLTTDNKISIGLSVDEALISSKAEAQQLVDAIFRNVKQMEMDILNMDCLH